MRVWPLNNYEKLHSTTVYMFFVKMKDIAGFWWLLDYAIHNQINVKHTHFLFSPLFSSPRRPHWRAVQYITHFKIMTLFNRNKIGFPYSASFVIRTWQPSSTFRVCQHSHNDVHFWNLCMKEIHYSSIHNCELMQTWHPNLESLHHN